VKKSRVKLVLKCYWRVVVTVNTFSSLTALCRKVATVCGRNQESKLRRQTGVNWRIDVTEELKICHSDHFIEFHGAFSLKVATVSVFFEFQGLILGEEIKSTTSNWCELKICHSDHFIEFHGSFSLKVARVSVFFRISRPHLWWWNQESNICRQNGVNWKVAKAVSSDHFLEFDTLFLLGEIETTLLHMVASFWLN